MERGKASRVKLLLVFLAAAAVFYFLDTKKLLEPIKDGVQAGVLPIQYAVYSAKRAVQDTFSFLTFWKSGERRIKHLEERNAELLVLADKTAALEKENKSLRAQLGAEPRLAEKMLPALVLGLSRYLEIEVGGNQGIKEGQTVISGNNYIGRIAQVLPRTSFVRLPTDPESKIPVKAGQGRGLAIGQFNYTILLDKVAQTEEISINNPVETSGEGGEVRPGLLVGRIKELTGKETDIFKQAVITPAVDYQKLEVVFTLSD